LAVLENVTGADGTTGITRAAKQVFLSKTTDIVSDLQGKKGLKKRFEPAIAVAVR
jgi:hypothetical protein